MLDIPKELQRLYRRLIKANARQEIRLRSAHTVKYLLEMVSCGSGRPQMQADNLKLAPVTLGFLNIIFNLGINITHTIF